MQICEKSKCTGCGVCADVCPQNCITLSYDQNGFLCSTVDETKCVQCKRCVAACPANHPQNHNVITAAYKLRRKDTEAIHTSTSGGAAALLAEMFIQNGGKVCGCGFDEALVLRHTIEDRLPALQKFKGSKYVQSNTAGIYRQVKAALQQGEKILFFGTPCQVSGLYTYLNKAYEGLYTVDLACHGVASGKILESYLEGCRQAGSAPVSVCFRNKRKGYQDCNLNDFIITCKDGERIVPHGTGIVLWFASGISLRESCYSCAFASTHRCGDITLADFKGDTLSAEEKMQGVSSVFVSTPKGEELLSMVKEQAHIQQKDPAKVVPLYSAFRQKGKIPAVRKKFFKDLQKLSLAQMEQKYTLKKILPGKLTLYTKAAMRKLRLIK